MYNPYQAFCEYVAKYIATYSQKEQKKYANFLISVNNNLRK